MVWEVYLLAVFAVNVSTYMQRSFDSVMVKSLSRFYF